MEWLAPVVSLLVALGVVVARLLPREGAAREAVNWTPIIVAAVFGGVLAGVSFAVGADSAALKTSLLYAGLGLAVAAVAGGLEASGAETAYDRVAPIAFAAALMLLFDAKGMKTAAPGLLGLTFGTGLGAMWLTFSTRRGGWPSGLTIALGAIAAVNLLGAIGVGGKSAIAGSALGTVLAVSGVLAMSSMELLKGRKPVAVTILAVVVLVGAWLMANRYVFLQDIFWISLLGLLASFSVAYIMGEDEEPGSFPFLLATIVWIGAATIGFGMLKGYGMAAGLLVAVGCLMALGSQRGLLTLGPVFGLVLYRLFREQHTDSSKALDIGQHYAMIGILVGLLIVMGLIEWARGRRSGSLSVTVAGGLAGLTALGALVVAIVLLGPKGTVGLLVGVGLVPLMFGLAGSYRWRPAGSSGSSVGGAGETPAVQGVGVLATTVAFLTAVALAYGPLDSYLDLERETKIRVLLWTVAIVLGLVAAVRLLGGPMQEKRS